MLPALSFKAFYQGSRLWSVVQRLSAIGYGFAVCHMSLKPSPFISPACLSAA
ncbi:hypothetical protein P3T22_001893 [Paraburkholderia sp. GAS348]